MAQSGELKRNAPAAFVVIVGIIASIAVYTAVRGSKAHQANAAFTTMASSHASIVVEGFSQAFFAIESVGALYDSSESVSPVQFAEFVAPLLERFPTIAALGWAPRVQHGGRGEFELAAQKRFPGFRITERSAQGKLIDSADRDVYFPVYFLRPYAGNEAAHGYDLYSNAVRREAIDRSRDSGKTVSTARIRLVQEEGVERYSVLLLHPVFANGASARQSGAFLGVASAVYRIGDGVERALSRVASEGLDLWLFDRSGEPGKQFLYFHPSGKSEAARQKIVSVPPADVRRLVHKFELGGRKFELVLSPAPGHFDISGGYLAWSALIAGLGFTGLLAAYLRLVARRSQELITGQQTLEHQINERKDIEQQLREANRNLEVLSRQDPLTGIANRRYFDEYFQQEWKRAVRDRTPLSLLLGDVDHFKSYNDLYGHVAGDQCLREIARVLSDAVDRPGDLAARFGGEEVAVVLPNTPEAGARSLAEKIRASVAELASLQGQSAVARTVTISLGCGTAQPTQTDSSRDFLQAVDAALYQAKQRGRNQTVSISAGE